jgi:hypothetical protein
MAAFLLAVPLVGCGKREEAPQSPKIADFLDINLADAVELLFGIATLSFKLTNVLKISWTLATGAITLDAKGSAGRGEATIKFPIWKLPFKVESKQQIIATLQAEIDKLQKRLRIRDDQTVLLLIRNPNGNVAPIPIRRDSPDVCAFCPSASVTRIAPSGETTVIEVRPLDPDSYVTVGTCSDLDKAPRIKVLIDEASEVGQGARIHMLQPNSAWTDIGRSAAIADTSVPFRIRVQQHDEVLWDGVFEQENVRPDCRLHEVNLKLREASVLSESFYKCAY